jgi:hypothetical protein
MSTVVARFPEVSYSPDVSESRMREHAENGLTGLEKRLINLPLRTAASTSAQRLQGAFSDERSWPELVHIANDGETYGHHDHRGEMALTYALEYIRSRQLADITNYGEYLERHPPTHDVEIFENSSWSCIHGIERWRANCGCKAGHPDWKTLLAGASPRSA